VPLQDADLVHALFFFYCTSRLDDQAIDDVLKRLRELLIGEAPRRALDHINALLDNDLNEEEHSDQASSYNSDEEFDSDDGASETDTSGSEESAVEYGDEHAGGADYVGVENLHPAVQYESIHCPPLAELHMEVDRVCNCNEFGLDCILQSWDNEDAPMDFTAIYEGAEATVDSEVRRPNNANRKALYRTAFSKLDFNDYEEGQRRRLPHCLVARIRQIYPSGSGSYMGFLEA
jgi:hypothetical protein